MKAICAPADRVAASWASAIRLPSVPPNALSAPSPRVAGPESLPIGRVVKALDAST
jgi:hypothetical protein